MQCFLAIRANIWLSVRFCTIGLQTPTHAIGQRIAASPVLYAYWTRRAGRLPLPQLAEELEKAWVWTLTPQAVSRVYRAARAGWLHRHVDWMALATALTPTSMAGEVTRSRFPHAGTGLHHGLRSQRPMRTRAA